MASLLFFLAVAVGAEQAADTVSSPNDGSASRDRAAAVDEPGFHEFQRRVSELLKREAQAKDDAARTAAVRAMCELHQRIVGDARYSTSDTLKEYRARLWSRLTKIKAELKRQLARDAKDKREALADLAALEAADPATVAAADSLASSLALLDQAQGGPGYFLSGGAFGGGTVRDFGWDLVALIERTINPAFWDVAGGPGTIVYYAPLQCLVVRATAEVHGNVGGVIQDLRAAGP
jgi:hypothetical protein